MKSKLSFVVMFIFIVTTISKVNAVDIEYIDGGGIYEFNIFNPVADSIRVDYDYSGPPTTVNYVDGAWTQRYFVAHSSSRINVSGGGVGVGLLAYENSVIDIIGGIMHSVGIHDNSLVTMSGGTINDQLKAIGLSKVFVSGGYIRNRGLETGGDSMVTISGGRIDGMLIRGNSQVTVTGGVFDDVFGLYNTATLIIDGMDFKIDGRSVANGDYNFNYSEWHNITGTLSNGDVLNNDFYPWESTATISLIPEPCSLVLLGLGGLALRRRKA